MDFNSLMSLAASRQEQSEKSVRVKRYSLDMPAARKEERAPVKSSVLQKLIQETKEEKRQKEERAKAKQKRKEEEERRKNHFRIPKSKPKLSVEKIKLINSLFEDDEEEDNKNVDDSGVHSGDSPGENQDGCQSSPDSGAEAKDNKIHGSSSVHKHSSSHKSSSSNHRSSSSSNHRSSSSSKDSSNHRSSSSSKDSLNHQSSSKDSSNHQSSSSKDSSNHRSSSSSKDSSNHRSASSHGHSSSSDSKSTQHRHSLSSSHKHSNGSKSSSRSSSSHQSSLSSSSSSQHKSKHSSSSKDNSSSNGSNSKPSSEKAQSSKSSDQKQSGVSRPNPFTQSSEKQPVTLSKHHLNPLVERQADSATPMSEREQILARLKAIKERTLAAIQTEHSAKGNKGKHRQSSSSGRSRDKMEDKAKSAEVVKEIESSSDEDEGSGTKQESALDIMLSEHEHKLQKEKITRMAKQAWERAQRKDAGLPEKEVKEKKKRKYVSKNVEISEAKKRKPNHVEPKSSQKNQTVNGSSSSSIGRKKKPLVRHAGQSGLAPMDFKAIMAMAEQKLKEPAKSVLPAPVKKKKKEEDERPLTQAEKDRRERVKSKEYQTWLKFGGKRPGQEAENGDVSPVQESSSSKPSLSPPHSAYKSLTKPEAAMKHAEHRRADNEPAKKLTVNENVLMCGPASGDEQKPSSNPFDRIMSKVHKSKHHQKQASAPRRIEDDDEDEESDLDGFIDDGDDGEMDYSKEIQKMFGYNKSGFAHEDEDDLSDMEANFATVMQEEKRSAKLGMMEDLEDMRQEEEENRRKALLRKQMRKGK